MLTIIQLTLMLCFWIIPPLVLWLVGIWKTGGLIWAIMWSAIGLLVALGEVVSYVITKRTLTQHITKWGKESTRNKWFVRSIIVLWQIGFLFLWWHFWV